jgi:hypothetical protein
MRGVMGVHVQQAVTYRVIGIGVGPGGKAVTLAYRGTDHGEAFRAGVAHWRECNADRYCGVGEVRMTATDYWGAVSVAGSWGVKHPASAWRAVLACTACGDERPDADVRGEGMSLGARCVHVDCGGVYRDWC